MHNGVKKFKIKQQLNHIIKAQEGQKVDWGQMAQLGMQAVQGIQSGIQANKAIEAQKAAIKNKRKQIEGTINIKEIDNQVKKLLESQQQQGDIHFGEIDYQNIRKKLLEQALAEAKKKADQYEQEALSQIDQNAGMNQITNSITGIAESGLGMLMQGFGNQQLGDSSVDTQPSSISNTPTYKPNTNFSVTTNNSMFNPQNYNNPVYVNNFWNMKKPSTN